MSARARGSSKAKAPSGPVSARALALGPSVAAARPTPPRGAPLTSTAVPRTAKVRPGAGAAALAAGSGCAVSTSRALSSRAGSAGAAAAGSGSERGSETTAARARSPPPRARSATRSVTATAATARTRGMRIGVPAPPYHPSRSPMRRDGRSTAARGGRSGAQRPGLFLCALACLAGCGDPGAEARIFVDGEPRLALAPSELGRPLDLCESLGLAPEGVAWVEICGDEGRALRVESPGERYAARILAAFHAAGGGGFRWVDPRLGALPARLDGPPAVALARAAEVHVRVGPAQGPPENPVAPTALRIETSAGGVFELAPSALAALPERTPAEVLG